MYAPRGGGSKDDVFHMYVHVTGSGGWKTSLFCVTTNRPTLTGYLRQANLLMSSESLKNCFSNRTDEVQSHGSRQMDNRSQIIHLQHNVIAFWQKSLTLRHVRVERQGSLAKSSMMSAFPGTFFRNRKMFLYGCFFRSTPTTPFSCTP